MYYKIDIFSTTSDKNIFSSVTRNILAASCISDVSVKRKHAITLSTRFNFFKTASVEARTSNFRMFYSNFHYIIKKDKTFADSVVFNQ